MTTKGKTGAPRNSAALHAEKQGPREGYTPAEQLNKVPAELDEPDVVTPTHAVCSTCGNPVKLDYDGNALAHRAHGHGAPDDDPICDGTGQPQ